MSHVHHRNAKLSRLIAEDDEYCLYNITLFKKIVEDFRNKCREEKFVVRDFEWNPEKLSADKRTLNELVTSEKELLVLVIVTIGIVG